MEDSERDYEDLYFKMRREAFVSQIAHCKGIELVNLILNPGSIGNIEDCARQFRGAVASAKKSMDAVDAGDVELAKYLDVRARENVS